MNLTTFPLLVPWHIARSTRGDCCNCPTLRSPNLGAHLVTPWFGFAHHGIYVGNGRVIQYGALMFNLIRKPVEEVSMARFASGRAVFVVQHAECCLGALEVVQRARSRLGEKRYRLFSNNCEHFVEWCLHDVGRSFQAETALAYPRQLGERIEARHPGISCGDMLARAHAGAGRSARRCRSNVENHATIGRERGRSGVGHFEDDVRGAARGRVASTGIHAGRQASVTVIVVRGELLAVSVTLASASPGTKPASA